MVMHTDHGNAARLEHMPLGRIDAKHSRWHSEITQRGPLPLYRSGTGALHKVPDGLGRNHTMRDHIILARTGDWAKHDALIRGVAAAHDAGEFDDEEPEFYVLLPESTEEQKAVWESFRCGRILPGCTRAGLRAAEGGPL